MTALYRALTLCVIRHLGGESTYHLGKSTGHWWIPTQMVSNVDLTLQLRHNDNDGVSNHQPHGCLPNRLFRRRSKKTSKLRVTGLCVGNSPGPVNSPHKGPVTRKMFSFDDVITDEMHPLSSALTICCRTKHSRFVTPWRSYDCN